MQLYINQLDSHLQNNLSPLYMVFGDDDFLRLQALASIRQAAQDKGYDERDVFRQSNDFSWHELHQSQHNLSLFANRRIIELEIPNAAPGAEGAKELQRFISEQAEDTLLLLHGPKLKAEQQRSKWFKALQAHGVFVPVFTPDKHKLGAFVAQRAQYYGISLDSTANQLLCAWYEGNLLALDQALAKLALLYPNQPLTDREVRSSGGEQSRYDVFTLQEALLAGDQETFFHRLQRLCDTGAEPAIIHWLLQREWQTMHSVFLKTREGVPATQALQSHGVWKNQQAAYMRLLRGWDMTLSQRIQALLVRVEMALKRDSKEDLTTLFSHIGLLFLSPQQLSMAEFTETDALAFQ